MEVALRRQALDDIFDQLKKSKKGNHNTRSVGQGDETTSELRPFEFGDTLDNIAIKETPAANFYDGLGSLKDVDLTAASLGFKIYRLKGKNFKDFSSKRESLSPQK